MAANAFTTLLGDTLQGKDGDVSTATALKGKTVGIYFSAHWCPPCRGFTPKLAETYTKMKAAGKPFEIVFASSDRDQGAFDGYFAEMPWLTLPYSDRDRKEALSKKFKVQGIPTLVILDENGETITVDGREAVGNDPAGEKFPWAPPTFAEALGEEFLGQGGATVQKSALEGKYLALYFSVDGDQPETQGNAGGRACGRLQRPRKRVSRGVRCPSRTTGSCTARLALALTWRRTSASSSPVCPAHLHLGRETLGEYGAPGGEEGESRSGSEDRARAPPRTTRRP